MTSYLVCSVLLQVQATKKNIEWKLLISTIQKVLSGSGANTRNKTDHTAWEDIKTGTDIDLFLSEQFCLRSPEPFAWNWTLKREYDESEELKFTPNIWNLQINDIRK